VHRHDLQRPEHRDLHPCERNTAARSHAAGAAGREGRVRELPDRRRLAFTASFITRCYCLCTPARKSGPLDGRSPSLTTVGRGATGCCPCTPDPLPALSVEG
jgi:hypothetical protein